MYSKILDQKTFLAVLQAAPDVPGEDDRLAQEIIAILKNQMFAESDFYSFPIQKIALQIESEVTPSQIGRILSQLGLTKLRHRDGYYVFSTVEQINIIEKALDEKVQNAG